VASTDLYPVAWLAASTMRGYLDEGTRTRTSNPLSNLGT